MKKLISGIIFSMLILMSSLSALAVTAGATLDFSAPAYAARAGDFFDVKVRVNPNGSAIDTVRAVISYDVNVLRAETVSLTGSWNRSAPANSVDQKNGLISWGGFSTKGSITKEQDFISITFSALKQGKSDIKILKESHALDGGEDRLNVSKIPVSTITVDAQATLDPSNEILTVSSASHPDDNKWYQQKDVAVSWTEIQSKNPVVMYYEAFDSASNTDPEIQHSANETSAQFKQVADGVYYFHLKAKRKDGTFTKTIHRRFGVDATIPNPFELSSVSEKILEGESVWLTFATTDETSGVADYQIAMNASKFQSGQISPLEITDLKKGTYFFRVAALDRAGNTMYASKSVRVYPKDANLGRPEGYSTEDGAKALLEKGKQITNYFAKFKPLLLLITFVLVVFVGFGIIYALKFKKRKT